MDGNLLESDGTGCEIGGVAWLYAITTDPAITVGELSNRSQAPHLDGSDSHSSIPGTSVFVQSLTSCLAYYCDYRRYLEIRILNYGLLVVSEESS